jgi:hypothetical protein
VERHVAIVLADGSEVRGRTSDEDEARLTREDTTAAVHFLKFRFETPQIPTFATGPARIVVDHPEYRYEAPLTNEQHDALVGDLHDLR